MRTDDSVSLRIAVVDDELRERTKVAELVQNIVAERGIVPLVSRYAEVETLLYDLDSDISFDLYFLDVEFGERHKDGMELARQIRCIQPRAYIVFVSSFVEKYASDGYLVQAFRFIPKELLQEKLPEAVNSMIDAILSENTNRYTVYREKEFYSFEIRDIVYIESVGKKCIFTLAKGANLQVAERGSLKQVMERLPMNEFIRIDKPYCVHSAHVLGIKGNQVIMDNGTALPISRNGKMQLKRFVIDKIKGNRN